MLVRRHARMGRLRLVLKRLLKVRSMSFRLSEKLTVIVDVPILYAVQGGSLQNYHLETTLSMPLAYYLHQTRQPTVSHCSHRHQRHLSQSPLLTSPPFVVVIITHAIVAAVGALLPSPSPLLSSFSLLLNLPSPTTVFCFYDDSRLLGLLLQFLTDLRDSWGSSLPYQLTISPSSLSHTSRCLGLAHLGLSHLVSSRLVWSRLVLYRLVWSRLI